MFLIFIPAILTAQKPANNPQSQQLLNKSNKSQFFIENKGQWPKLVKFLARLGGLNCWITDSGVVYDYFRIDHNYSPDSLMRMPRFEKDEFEQTHTSCKGHVVRMDYNGINLNAEKQGIDKREAYYNYFIGNDSTKWASFVGLFGEVIVKDAYPGIDIRYYFDSGQIRYDYLVKPGADISQINFRLTGADALAVSESGELVIKTSLGEVKHGKLYAYQQYGNEKKEVSCRFERNENGDFGVIASDYEKGLALVVDPLVWSTYLGGTDYDIAVSLCLDRYRNVILTGKSGSSNFPTTSGAYSNTLNGVDIFTTKLNSTASSLIFSTFIGETYGGGSNPLSSFIVIDTSGNSYITGTASSNNFPTTNGAFDQTYNGGGSDAFITKLNSTGSALIYSTYIGGSGLEFSFCISIDEFDNAYITGSTSSSNFPTTSSAYNQTYNGGTYDVFVTKLNASGTALDYSTYIGGSSADEGFGLTLDLNHNVYITGRTSSINFPTTNGAYDQTWNGGSYDAFITKLNSTGTALVFSTYIGGNLWDEGERIIFDSLKNIFIIGSTNSANFPTTPGAFKQSFTANQTGTDIIISKFDSSATTLIASTFLGGNNQDVSFSVALDVNDNLCITGLTGSSDFPLTHNAIKRNVSVNGDAFISKLSSNLSTLIYSSYLGGSGFNEGFAIVCDSDNKIYVVGQTSSSDYPTTSGVYDQNFNGNIDAFVTKLDLFSQAYNLDFPIISCSKMRISWEKGDGKKRVVFIKEGNSGYPSPVNNNAYTANTVFGNGSQIGSSGWYCIYNDTGTTVTITGLNLITNYRIMVLEDTGTTANDKYVTDSTLNNPLNHFSGSYPVASFIINDSIQCQKGNKFVFTNTSYVFYGFLVSLWRFGDGDSSTKDQTVHSYSSANTFNVKLVVSSDPNCSDTLSKKIQINPSPIASFSVNDSIQCMKWNKFVFTNNSSISSGSFSSRWQFGDSTGSVIKNPVHSYSSYDTFLVKLLVTSDSGCADSVIKKAYVDASPKSKFIIYDSSQCLERNNFGFINTSSIVSGSISFLWNFGDGNSSTVTNPSYSYSVADTYAVLLISTSDKNCIDSFTGHTYILVHPEPLAAFSINDSSQCLKRNDFVCLNNSTIKSGTFSQQWQFGDGFDTVSYHTSHSYKTVDSFMIKLLIISDWGCKDSILKKVIVHPEQTTSFNLSDSNVCVGEAISLTNTSSNNTGALSYLWYFGDGDTSHAIDPQHSYKTDGTFTILLFTINKFGCIDSANHKVNVFPLPTAGFTIDKDIQCLRDNSFKLISSSLPAGSLTYLWDFGDGTNASLKDTSHIYSKADSFYIKLITTTLQGCKDSMRKQVFVKPDQTTAYNLSDTSVCIGELIQFNNSSSYNYGTLTFNWDFGDGNNSGTQNPQYSYSIDSTFKVKLVSTNNFGCKDSIFHKVYVNPFPKTDFAINDTAQCLSGNSFTFTDKSSIKSGNIIQNYFDFGDGTISTLSSVSHGYVTYDTFLVKLVAKSNQGCADSITKTVYVRPMPKAGFSINTKTQNLAGNNFIFTSTSIIPSGNLKYNWYFGDGDTSNAANPTHSYTAAGSYKVKMIATSDFGCADTFSDSVFVLSYPVHVYFTVQNACAGEQVLFKNTSTVNPPDSFLNFLWDFGDGSTIIKKEPKHIYTLAGKYITSLTVLTAFGSKDTLTDTLEIFAEPMVNITAAPDTIVIPGIPVTLTASGFYDQLLWFDNSTAGSVLVTTEGKYWVMASYTNGCKSYDTIILTKGEVREPEIVNVITPNGDGINDKLVIKNIDLIKPCKLSIYNRWGDELFSTSDYQNNWDGTYKGKKLPEGTYYYVLVAKGGTLYKGAVNILK